MSAATGRHPSDDERAEAALPVLEALVRAAAAADADGVAACLDEDVVWLDAAGPTTGREEAARRLLERAGAGARWPGPRQHGAHAVLGWTTREGSPGGVVVEVRRARVVLVAAP